VADHSGPRPFGRRSRSSGLPGRPILFCRAGALLGILWLTLLAHVPKSHAAPSPAARSSTRAKDLQKIIWPDGVVTLKFENLEGAILLPVRMRSIDRDTTGPLLLDTGAGYLALDLGLARMLRVADPHARHDEVSLSERSLPTLELGTIRFSRVGPVLLIDGGVIRRATDRPALGLLGQALFADRVLALDYRDSVVAIGQSSNIDVRPLLSPNAIRVPFQLEGDGKIVIRARVVDPRSHGVNPELTMIVDTGATKTVLFERALERILPSSHFWRRMRGLSAPTLIGEAHASIARVPQIQIESADGRVAWKDVDAAIMESPLERVLSDAVGEPVYGLLGYSFLKHFRTVIDYPMRALWLDPLPNDHEDRPNEYTHIGIQLERVDGAMRVIAVVEDSPAEHAGIAVGDDVTSIDGQSTQTMDIVTASIRLEGPPGSRIAITVRQGDHERTYALVRRRLL
jgi:hypothetical protein